MDDLKPEDLFITAFPGSLVAEPLEAALKRAQVFATQYARPLTLYRIQEVGAVLAPPPAEKTG